MVYRHFYQAQITLLYTSSLQFKGQGKKKGERTELKNWPSFVRTSRDARGSGYARTRLAYGVSAFIDRLRPGWVYFGNGTVYAPVKITRVNGELEEEKEGVNLAV